jgi:hypothetical protein
MTTFTWAEKGRIAELETYMKRNGLRQASLDDVCRVCKMSIRQAAKLMKKIRGFENERQ